MKPSFKAVNVTLPEARHFVTNRTFQGIPGIAISKKNRIFALWYAGGPGEGPENFVTLCLSDDNGRTWSDSVAVVDPPHPNVRAYDANIWFSPEGKLHMFWSQAESHKLWDTFDGSAGVWFSILENDDHAPENFHWTEPVRICDGIMMNKPTVLANGTWALPVSVWSWKGLKEEVKADPEHIGAKIIVSQDNGRTFSEIGKAVAPAEIACFDEHTIIEMGDGSLKMIIRVTNGNVESYSYDNGRNWTTPICSNITGPNSRLWISRLKSGRLVLVNNDYIPPDDNSESWPIREKLTAWLSDDEGLSWYGSLCLDPREQVSYPDGQQLEDGSIWIVYDHSRMREGEILAAHITEEDITAGSLVNPESRMQIIVSKTGGIRKASEDKYHA
jgi:hypothetical protein